VTSARQVLGASGEQMAADWYIANGYEVAARNWRCREGELDLVLKRGRKFVFCEVKTRSSTAFGAPAEAVTRAKQTRLRHLAAKFIDDTGVRPVEIRFDVVSVLAGQLEVLQGAF